VHKCPAQGFSIAFATQLFPLGLEKDGLCTSPVALRGGTKSFDPQPVSSFKPAFLIGPDLQPVLALRGSHRGKDLAPLVTSGAVDFDQLCSSGIEKCDDNIDSSLLDLCAEEIALVELDLINVSLTPSQGPLHLVACPNSGGNVHWRGRRSLEVMRGAR
jgi:hypothetical protein